MPQGLGTGGLYINNFDCPLQVTQGQLWHSPELIWGLNIDTLFN
jgi:o-succinylbenzoate synthase